jgi:hypothetical protein
MAFECASVVTAKYTPHGGGQTVFHDSKARYKLLNTGCIWGKDRASIHEFIQKFASMLNEDRGTAVIPKVRGLLLAANFPLMLQLWREVKEFFPEGWTERVYEGDKLIITKGGGLIEVRAASDGDDVVAGGYDIALISEAARIENLAAIWHKVQVGMMSPGRGPGGNGGLLIANSTPKRGSFWNRIIKTQREQKEWSDTGVELFNYPTWCSPLIRGEDIEKVRYLLKPDKFAEEFGGEVF